MQYPSHNTDGRTGQGYGLTKDRFHKPRMSQPHYPYFETSENEEDLEDEELYFALKKKVMPHRVNDFGAHKSTEPFYFAAGNTKLSDCFFRTDKVLLEVEALGDSMAPIPQMYKGPKVGLGGATHLTTGNMRKTGDHRGWSKAIDFEDDSDDEPEIYSLEDLAAYLDLSPRHT